MIHITCNLCRRLVPDTDRDAFREGVTDTDRRRADICGACMRDAADRVLSRLRTSVRLVDPTPPTVQEQARSIRLPDRLRRQGT